MLMTDMPTPGGLHVRVAEEGKFPVAVEDDPVGWRELEAASRSAPMAFHTLAYRLAHIFASAASAYVGLHLAPDPERAAASLGPVNDLLAELVEMNRSLAEFERAHPLEPLRVANHWELAYRTAYRSTLLCMHVFCAEARISTAQLMVLLEAECATLSAEFPSLRVRHTSSFHASASITHLQ